MSLGLPLELFITHNNDLDDGAITYFQVIRLFHLGKSFVQPRDLRNISNFLHQLLTSWRLR